MAAARAGRPRQVRLPENVCGEQVRLALREASPSGLHKRQLVMATDLSPYQVGKGLLWIKQIAAQQHLTPLIWDQKNGYRFSADPTDWLVYERTQFRIEFTRITRLISGTIAPHAAARPDDRAIQHILNHLRSIESTLDMLAHP